MAPTPFSFDATKRQCLLQTWGVQKKGHQDWASGIVLHVTLSHLYISPHYKFSDIASYTQRHYEPCIGHGP
jgi:hypothetical protein